MKKHRQFSRKTPQKDAEMSGKYISKGHLMQSLFTDCVKNRYIIITVSLFLFILFLSSYHRENDSSSEFVYLMDGFRPVTIGDEDHDFEHSGIMHDFFSLRKNWNLSALGSHMFWNVPYPDPVSEEKTFKILIYNRGPFLERRHLMYFTDKKHDPFEKCSVKNCILTYDLQEGKSADAVMVLLHRLENVDDLPKFERPKNQRWIFLTDESPFATFLYKGNHWSNYSGVFNWSMSYRIESDIPVPYGRTLPLPNSMKLEARNSPIEKLIPNFDIKKKDVLAAAAISNCVDTNHRFEYVKELAKHMEVDIYGGCSTNPITKNGCPSFYVDCPNLNNYTFYLAFENANCNQYMTEKVFHNMAKGSIPVIMGTSRQICRELLPPGSFIHIEDFSGPETLAEYLKELGKNESRCQEFHKWRRHFQVVNEHGYMGDPSYHYCRICEALNYNDEAPKVYMKDDLYKLLSFDNCQDVSKLHWKIH